MGIQSVARVLVFLAAWGGIGCAHVPRASQELKGAEEAVQKLGQRDLAGVTQALEHKKLAMEQLKEAKGILGEGNVERAKSMFLRSQSDADLALALADEAQARNARQKVTDELRRLKGGLQ